jgi:hypothetical protein
MTTQERDPELEGATLQGTFFDPSEAAVLEIDQHYAPLGEAERPGGVRNPAKTRL